MQKASLIAVAVFLLLVSACANNYEATYGETLPIPDTTTPITAGDLRVGPMDTLDIQVFGVSDLNGMYQVDFEGMLKMPLIGEVAAIGRTSVELSYELEQRYGESYLQDPAINVTITESVDRRITVDGAVNSPGLYPISGRLSLLQAVALAGGPSQGSNPRKVLVKRQIDGAAKGAVYDLTAIRRGQADDPQIYGNDVIVMDGSQVRGVYGEALRSVQLVALLLAF